MADSVVKKTILEGQRHVNTQTFGSNSSTPIFETEDNPAFSTAGNTGMLIQRVRMYPKNSDPIVFATGASYNWVSQLCGGTQDAILEIGTQDLVAQANAQLTFLTGVGVQVTKMWPFEMLSVASIPAIVAPSFTVGHDCEVNHAAFQEKDIKTVIDYDVVEFSEQAFRTMYINQTNQS